MTSYLELQFPAGGLARGVSYQRQAPFTTPDCNNVQPEDTLEGRIRGGSRPGLQRTHVDNGGKVNLLQEVSIARVEGDARTIVVDQFQGDGFASEWDAAFTGFPTLAPEGEYPVAASTDDGKVGAVLEDKSPVNTQLTITEIFIEPYRGFYNGQTYGIVVGATDESTFDEEFTLTLSGDDYTLKRSGTTVATGSNVGAFSGWFRVEVRGNDTATVVWAGRVIHTTAADLTMGGDRVGFSLEAATDGVAFIEAFRYGYSASDPGTGFRDQLVACNAGIFYREDYPGVMSAVGETAQYRVNATERVRAQGHLQKLWIADHGRVAGGEDGVMTSGVLTAASVADWTAIGLTDDMRVILTNVTGVTQGTYDITTIASGGLTLTGTTETGTCNWRVVRSPKVYDPIANTVSEWTATAGTYPAGCSIIARYRDRIVLAGDPLFPHLWYMSRQGDPQDFDYGVAASDVQRAVAGQNSDAGVVGDAITALIPHSDDFLVVGCESSTWVIRGDPAYGGQIDALSRVVGIVGPDAWAAAPDGSTWFVAQDGVYAIPPGAQGQPQAVSEGPLPREFRQFGSADVQCVWDVEGGGLRIFIGKEEGGPHWLVRNGTFWPLTLSEDARPFTVLYRAATSAFDGPVIMGGTDGAIRRFNDSSPDDDGSAFTSYVDFGPVRLTPTERGDGCVNEAIVVTDQDSGNVTARVYVGDVAEKARLFTSWTVLPAEDRVFRPRARGHSARLRIEATAPWAFESAVLGVQPRGKRRV